MKTIDSSGFEVGLGMKRLSSAKHGNHRAEDIGACGPGSASSRSWSRGQLSRAAARKQTGFRV